MGSSCEAMVEQAFDSLPFCFSGSPADVFSTLVLRPRSGHSFQLRSRK
jgi:hypothetical protein